jgi:hypothetical protein
MRLPQQPNFRILVAKDNVTGEDLRVAMQWMWQELVKAINQNALMVDEELVDPNLSSTDPAAPTSNTNVIWQHDDEGNISGYVPTLPGGPPTGVAAGDLAGTYPNPTFDPTVVTAFAKTFLDDANAPAVRATIGAGTSSVTLPITEADVTSLVSDLAGKAATAHTHAESDVTSLVSDLAGKAALSHSHAEADVTGLVVDLSTLASAITAKVTANGAIAGDTKTKITYDTKGLVTAGADATTADIADSANKRYVTDAQQVVIGNTSGTNTGDQSLAGYVPTTRTLTINGTAQDLSSDRSWTVTASLPDVLAAVNSPAASQTILTGTSAYIYGHYDITGSNSLSIQGTGVLEVG